MTPTECAEALRKFNEWRRWDGEFPDEGPAMPHPKEIGVAIDTAIGLIEQRDEQAEEIEVLQIQLDFLKGVQEKNIVLAAKLREAEKQRDELLAALEHVLDGALSLPRFAEKQARDAIASVKGGA